MKIKAAGGEQSTSKRRKGEEDPASVLDLLRGSPDDIISAYQIIDQAGQPFIYELSKTLWTGAFETAVDANMQREDVIAHLSLILSMLTADAESRIDEVEHMVSITMRVLMKDWSNPDIYVRCCYALGNMADDYPEVEAQHIEELEDALERIAHIMKTYPELHDIQDATCYAISAIFRIEGAADHLAEKAIKSELPKLVAKVIRDFDSNTEVWREGLQALYELVTYAKNNHLEALRTRLAGLGAIEILVNYLSKTENPSMYRIACDTLGNFMNIVPSRVIAIHCGAVQAMLRCISLAGSIDRIVMEAFERVTCGQVYVHSGILYVRHVHRGIPVDSAFLLPLCRLPGVTGVEVDRLDDVEATFRMLASCENIQKVFIQGIPVTNTQVGILLQSPFLEIVNLSNTMVNDQVAPFILASTSLKEVVLSYTAFGDHGLQQIARSTTLWSAGGYGTLVTPECAKEAANTMRDLAKHLQLVLENLHVMKHLPVDVLRLVSEYTYMPTRHIYVYF